MVPKRNSTCEKDARNVPRKRGKREVGLMLVEVLKCDFRGFNKSNGKGLLEKESLHI